MIVALVGALVACKKRYNECFVITTGRYYKQFVNLSKFLYKRLFSVRNNFSLASSEGHNFTLDDVPAFQPGLT